MMRYPYAPTARFPVSVNAMIVAEVIWHEAGYALRGRAPCFDWLLDKAENHLVALGLYATGADKAWFGWLLDTLHALRAAEAQRRAAEPASEEAAP
jgi:hypothetical protein